jgi:REP element-mobilizing transposase RayT
MDPKIVHHIYYSWSGWPESGSNFEGVSLDLIETLSPTWRTDGFEVVSARVTPTLIQITCRVEPSCTPVHYATRIKGRLQHALRMAGVHQSFARKLSVRGIGFPPRASVENYLAQQVSSSELLDEKYRSALEALHYEDDSIDLHSPFDTHRGRYWNALHVVLVTAERIRLGSERSLPAVRASLLDGLRAAGHPVARLALMPDHVHLLVKAKPEYSPHEVALVAHEGSNRALGCWLWQDSVYVATVGEYSVNILPRTFGVPTG